MANLDWYIPDAFGDAKWQIAPLAGFRGFVPEVSKDQGSRFLQKLDRGQIGYFF
jgi:hypothetical protein